MTTETESQTTGADPAMLNTAVNVAISTTATNIVEEPLTTSTTYLTPPWKISFKAISNRYLLKNNL
jgi:hypothetical protein